MAHGIRAMLGSCCSIPLKGTTPLPALNWEMVCRLMCIFKECVSAQGLCGLSAPSTHDGDDDDDDDDDDFLYFMSKTLNVGATHLHRICPNESAGTRGHPGKLCKNSVFTNLHAHFLPTAPEL